MEVSYIHIRGFPPPGGAEDGGKGPQTSTGLDMGVYTHWGGAGNGMAEGYWGVYRLPPENGCTVHYEYSYHGLVSGGGAEAGTVPIHAMVGSARYGYPGDKGGTFSS